MFYYQGSGRHFSERSGSVSRKGQNFKFKWRRNVFRWCDHPQYNAKRAMRTWQEWDVVLARKSAWCPHRGRLRFRFYWWEWGAGGLHGAIHRLDWSIDKLINLFQWKIPPSLQSRAGRTMMKTGLVAMDAASYFMPVAWGSTSLKRFVRFRNHSFIASVICYIFNFSKSHYFYCDVFVLCMLLYMLFLYVTIPIFTFCSSVCFSKNITQS